MALKRQVNADPYRKRGIAVYEQATAALDARSFNASRRESMSGIMVSSRKGPSADTRCAQMKTDFMTWTGCASMREEIAGRSPRTSRRGRSSAQRHGHRLDFKRPKYKIPLEQSSGRSPFASIRIRRFHKGRKCVPYRKRPA